MLNNLTGLRFYAAFFVFLYHFFPVYTTIPKIEFFEIGFLGVDIFFILSGFILTYVYYTKFFVNKLTGRDYWSFIVKRFAKIYPLHFIITLLFIPVTYIGKYLFHQDSLNIYPDTLIQNFLMIHSWDTTMHLSWNFPSWSISAEWFAYLFLFAPLAYIYKLSRISLILMSVFIVLGFVAYWINIPEFILDRYTMNGLPRIIPEFILGVLAGLMKIKINFNKKTASFLFLMSVIFLVLSFSYDLYFQQLCIFGFAGTILSLSYKTYFDDIFSSKLLIYLGNISYAFYLTQFLSLIIYEQLFKILFPDFWLPYIFVIQFSMAFIINFIFAALAYKYFEEPLRLLIVKKLIKK